MKINGSYAVMQSLLAEGVNTVFGFPGGAIMPIYDALYDYRDKIRHILVRHEQAAAHAAEGYAKISGKPGVCFATSGPGATNLVTGIADAMMDSIPIVCITGQVTAPLVGTDAFQEVDIVGMTTPITKWNWQITRAIEIPEIIQKAFYIARTGRPGPVVIDITKNAQIELMDNYHPKNIFIESYQPNYRPNIKQIKIAADILNEAKKPFIFVGHGVIIAKAQNETRKLAEKANVPIASTLLGLSAINSSHPLNMGMLGMHGHCGPNILTNQADVILALGMRFDDRITSVVTEYAKKAKIIHIDIDPAELNKIIKVHVPIVADVKQALLALLPLIKKANHADWISEFENHKKNEYKELIKKEVYPRQGKIRMGEAMRMLSEKTKGKALVVADVGQHQMMAARYYQTEKIGAYSTSGGLGTMGYALPAAIGTKVGAPNDQVVAVIGDGSFQMNIQELATIMQDKIPVKIVIIRNNFLGMVRQWQELFFNKRYSFTTLANPDFVAVARGFFIKAERVKKREELSLALDRMLSSREAYLLEVNVENEQNVFPMIPPGLSVEAIRLE